MDSSRYVWNDATGTFAPQGEALGGWTKTGLPRTGDIGLGGVSLGFAGNGMGGVAAGGMGGGGCCGWPGIPGGAMPGGCIPCGGMPCGGGGGIAVGHPGVGGRLAPPGIGASEAYFGGAVPFGAVIGEGTRARQARSGKSGAYAWADAIAWLAASISNCA